MAVNFNINKLLNSHQKSTDLWIKINEVMTYVVAQGNDGLADIEYKYTDPDVAKEETIKNTMTEEGFDYIVSLMNTIDGFSFNTMLYFISLINRLKGTRAGVELVLRLLGFDAIIREWWEDPDDLGEPNTFEIIVFMNTSYIPDVFDTLEKVQVFLRNYVYALLVNVEVKFIFDKFARRAPIMGGFSKNTRFGTITQRAY